MWLPVRENRRDELRLRDGFLVVVALFWIVLGTFGALPPLFLDRVVEPDG